MSHFQVDTISVIFGAEEYIHYTSILACQIWPWWAKAGEYRAKTFKILSNLRYFAGPVAPQGRHCMPIKLKFSTEEYTIASLLHAKFGPDRRKG